MLQLTCVRFGGSGCERSNGASATTSCRSSNLSYRITDQSLAKQYYSIPEALTVVTVEVGIVGDKQPQAEVICGLRVYSENALGFGSARLTLFVGSGFQHGKSDGNTVSLRGNQ